MTSSANFSSAVSGIEEAARDISLHEVELPNDVRLNRVSLDHNVHSVREEMIGLQASRLASFSKQTSEPIRSASTPVQISSCSNEGPSAGSSDTPPDTEKQKSPVLSKSNNTTHRGLDTNEMNLNEVMTCQATGGAILKTARHGVVEGRRPAMNSETTFADAVRNAASIPAHEGDARQDTDLNTDGQRHQASGREGNESWNTVKSRNEKKRENNVQKKAVFTAIRGSRETGGGNFKAAERLVDLFLGGVDRDASSESIKEYILNTFNVDIVDIAQLHILSQRYNAFKLTVRLFDKEKLFKPELWPQGIELNKFYNRVKKSSTRPDV